MSTHATVSRQLGGPLGTLTNEREGGEIMGNRLGQHVVASSKALLERRRGCTP
jgi:hypothetical protein